MRNACIGMLLLAWMTLVAGPGPSAQAPSGNGPQNVSAPSHGEHAPSDGDEDQLPIQAYYHASFFSQPWRVPGQAHHVLARAAVVGGLDIVVFLVLAIETRRRFGRAGPASPGAPPV